MGNVTMESATPYAQPQSMGTSPISSSVSSEGTELDELDSNNELTEQARSPSRVSMSKGLGVVT